jgi:predicted amidophosphoribosyltransferase
MVDPLFEALCVAGERARQAAGAPKLLYICRGCELTWESRDPICWKCGRVIRRCAGPSLEALVKASKPFDATVAETHFEILGLG